MCPIEAKEEQPWHVGWRDAHDDELDRDWWEEDEEEEAYGYPCGRYPRSTIMGMPYPLAIDIMRGKWPSGREDSSFLDDGGAFDPGGDDPFWDPFDSGGGFCDGGGMEP